MKYIFARVQERVQGLLVDVWLLLILSVFPLLGGYDLSSSYIPVFVIWHKVVHCFSHIISSSGCLWIEDSCCQ